MVSIYTEATGWIYVYMESFYKTQIKGELDFLEVWHFKTEENGSFYSILRKHIQAIHGSKQDVEKLEGIQASEQGW